MCDACGCTCGNKPWEWWGCALPAHADKGKRPLPRQGGS